MKLNTRTGQVDQMQDQLQTLTGSEVTISNPIKNI